VPSVTGDSGNGRIPCRFFSFTYTDSYSRKKEETRPHGKVPRLARSDYHVTEEWPGGDLRVAKILSPAEGRR